MKSLAAVVSCAIIIATWVIPPVGAYAHPNSQGHEVEQVNADDEVSGVILLLQDGLKSEDQYVRYKAAASLRSNLTRNAARIPSDLVILALNSEDYWVRHEAIEGLRSAPVDLFQRAFKEALTSGDEHVRHRAAEILAAADSDTSPPAPVIRVTKESLPDPEKYESWERKWSLQIPEWRDDDYEDLRVRYNRVEGAYLGWQIPRRYKPGRFLTHYGEVGRALGLERWEYHAGASVFTYYRTPDAYSHLASFGFEVHDLIDSQDDWLISEEENSLSSVLFHRDFMDFYRRHGLRAYHGHNIGGILQVTVAYNRDRFEFADRSVEWALMTNMFARDNFRPNPAIDEGVVASGRVDVQLDTRDRVANPHQGWLINGLFERAGGIMAGDHRFKRYLLDLRRYQPVGVGTRFDVRLRSGSAKGDLPAQYNYDLGGFSTLRGYPFKSITGDRMVLVNLEYWVDLEEHSNQDFFGSDLGLGAFFDAGSAWFAGDASDPFEGVDDLVFQGSHGGELWRSFGFAVGSERDGFRVEFARPLDGPVQDWDVLARFSRSF